MTIATLRRLACIFFLAAGFPVQASFHLWTINEIYSNADGTVQYIELTTADAGQQFLAGHTVSTSSTGSATQNYTFGTNLPGDSAGKKFLIATSGFAALGILVPDYVVPNGFLFKHAATLDFSGVDVWNYANTLPTDGFLSLNRNGTQGINSPTNFAGATAQIAPPGGFLANLATRGPVLTGDGVMIGGFIIQGTKPRTVIVTVAGPSLTGAGVPGALANPTLIIIRASDGVVIANNDDWQTQTVPAHATAISAAGFAPANALEPAVYLTLGPGAYTAIVQGAGGTTGIALIGVYMTP
ncbi:hypothetical protein [Usitatibacter palustris]|uniref:DUF4198 domain-containing protein n=1 Tax=Usitatibacter palustris TaxID=2732487 RepID=A0A6M4HA78_9PROT|nr:hypothetical protein [Usitatibacter palustris]QJR16520.1 hypothetical protein DSM104440_03355 [Usitatibacter palustris]